MVQEQESIDFQESHGLQKLIDKNKIDASEGVFNSPHTNLDILSPKDGNSTAEEPDYSTQI